MSNFNPATDLVIERDLDFAPHLVWEAWTIPDEVVQWFTPKPWSTASAAIDLRPGGEFGVTMCDPDGKEYPYSGCYLEIVPNEKLIWTSALGPGYRPAPSPSAEHDIRFTAVLTITPKGDGCHYRVELMHMNEDSKKAHEGMGFDHGWNAALDQLIESVKRKSA